MCETFDQHCTKNQCDQYKGASITNQSNPIHNIYFYETFKNLPAVNINLLAFDDNLLMFFFNSDFL